MDDTLKDMDRQDEIRAKAEADYKRSMRDWAQRTASDPASRVNYRQRMHSRSAGTVPERGGEGPRRGRRAGSEEPWEQWKSAKARSAEREGSRLRRAEAEERARAEEFTERMRQYDEELEALGREIEAKKKEVEQLHRSEWEQKWTGFVSKAKTSDQITYDDIPWIADNLSVGLVDENDSSSQRKRKFHQAMLRWHPDKFVSAYGTRLAEGERDRIMEQVTSTASRLFEEMEADRRRQ